MRTELELQTCIYATHASFDKTGMPAPYSLDLRWRSVWLFLVPQMSPAEISQYLCVSQRTVQRYISMFEQTGDVKPITQRHGPPKLLGEFEQLLLLRMISENVGIYLHEIQEKIQAIFGVAVSLSTLCRTLKFMGCTRQVCQRIALQRSYECRARFMAEISIYDPHNYVDMD